MIAYMATSAWVPFRSMPSKISAPSSFMGVAERTFSFLLTSSWMLGFTSRDTREATALLAL